MNVALRLFLSSATFALGIGLAYWIVARDPTGTVLLGVMALAFGAIAGYMRLAQREARLVGDDPDAAISDGAGEIVGTYISRSGLPLWLALAITTIGVGLVLTPAISALGVIALLTLIALMILGSR